jgi:uncharacterized protein YjiS (DUF1127 family)
VEKSIFHLRAIDTAPFSPRITTMSRYYDERAVLSAGSFGLAAMLDAVDRRLVQPLLARRRKRAAYRELMALDDRQLADIGVARGEIDLAVSLVGRMPPYHA